MKNLEKHVEILCEVLNKNEIINHRRIKYFTKIEEQKWACDGDPRDVFMAEILWDTPAFQFLKSNGYIDIGVCWH